MFLQLILWGLWGKAVEFEEAFFNVPRHWKRNGAVGVIPFDLNATKGSSCPISFYLVVGFEWLSKVDSMFFTDLFDSKVIDDKRKYNRAGLVLP